MAPKRKQRSRLNSLEKTNQQTENSLEIKRKSSDLLNIEETKINEEETYKIEHEQQNELQEIQSELEITLSRTSLLIQEYFQFKAARCIQRFVSGWLCRTEYRRKREAAIKIQAEWRCFYFQRTYIHKVEEYLQKRIEQHFYRSAQKIQALWRGWWVRHHIHDFARMKRLQLMMAEDLLYCVAFKLHHLLRTHQIPGVYSLRNSNAFSKVEQLLASLKFKAFNQRSIQVINQSCYEKHEAKKQHKKSAFGTKIPFPGPDIYNLCLQKCAPIYNAKDADMRMSKILDLYNKANRDLHKPNALRKKTAPPKQDHVPFPSLKSSSFCNDILKSMRKWKIITENKLNVDSNIFKSPKNLENFVKEIESKMSFLQDNCLCKGESLEELNKRKTKHLSEDQKVKNEELTQNGMKSPTSYEMKQTTTAKDVTLNLAISTDIFTIDEAKSYMKEIYREKPTGAQKIMHSNFFEEGTTSETVT